MVLDVEVGLALYYVPVWSWSGPGGATNCAISNCGIAEVTHHFFLIGRCGGGAYECWYHVFFCFSSSATLSGYSSLLHSLWRVSKFIRLH